MLQNHSPAVGNALKTAFKLLVQRLGGLEAVSACCRGTKTLLSQYGDPTTDRWVPVDVLLDMETIAGEPLVTSAIARAQGYDLMPIVPHGEGDLHQHLAKIGETSSELFREAALALADGVVDDDEAHRVAMRMRMARAALHRGEVALLKRFEHRAPAAKGGAAC